MSTFNVVVTVANLSEPDRRRELALMVDTGATYTTLPQDIVDALGSRSVGTRRVLLASGREEEWPVAVIEITVGEQQLPTICLISPVGGPALLGAVTLEEFALGVDPVAQRLVPVRGYLMTLERVKWRRRAVVPSIRHHAERLDEPLPAARERDRHAEVEDLILAEVRA
jgi:clan AA aspartic protease